MDPGKVLDVVESPRVRRAALVAGAAALVVYFVVLMTYRMAGAASEWAVDGDQHQSIGHFLRYHLPGAMPRGNLLVDYAFAYHATPLWWVVMATMSTVVEPLLAAKILHVVAYAAVALGAVLVVGRRTNWGVGIVAGFFVLRSPDLPEQITGGMARSIGPALLYAFLLAFIERRHKLVLALLVVQAAVYPSVVIPCGLAYGGFCLVKGPMNERVRRCASLAVAGLLVVLVGKAQDLKAQEWWGGLVTYEEARAMPAWSRDGGRFPEVPHRTFEEMLHYNLARFLQRKGHALVDDPELQKTLDRYGKHVFLGAPAVLALCAVVVARARRRPGEKLPPFPWEWLWLIACGLAAYWLVRLLSFRLFLPSRQLGYTLQYLLMTGLPVLVWYGATALAATRRAPAVVAAAALILVPLVSLRGDSLERTRAGYRDHAHDKKLWRAVRKLPLDQPVACDLYTCELMMVLGQHVPYAARNLTHPIRRGYYEEAERRFVEMHRVLYATAPETIASFVAKENVRYFAYRKSRIERVDNYHYRPVKARIQAVFDEGNGRPRLLDAPPREAIVFEDGDRMIVDLTKFSSS